MSDDLTKPEVCVCSDEIAFAIADYGRKSIAAKAALAVAVAFLECLFRDRPHMVKHKDEIKFHCRQSLAEDKQEILRRTDSFLGKKGQTPGQKELMGLRAKISKEINKIYLELLNATFPVDDDVVVPSPPKKSTAVDPPTPSTPGVSSTPNTPLEPSNPSTPSEFVPMPNQYVPPPSSTPDIPPPFKMGELSSAIDEMADEMVISKMARSKGANAAKPAKKSPLPVLLDVPEEVTMALGITRLSLMEVFRHSFHPEVPSPACCVMQVSRWWRLSPRPT